MGASFDCIDGTFDTDKEELARKSFCESNQQGMYDSPDDILDDEDILFLENFHQRTVFSQKYV